MATTTNFQDWFNRVQFSRGVRTRIYHKLATYLRNGVSDREAIRFLWNHVSNDGRKANHPVAIILDRWREALRNGKTFGAAIAEWVPESEHRIISAGETANLSNALESAVFVQQAQAQVVSAIRMGTLYPIMLLAISIVFLVVMDYQAIPAFRLSLPAAQWPTSIKTLTAVADFVVGQWYLPAGIITVIIVSVSVSMARLTGRIRVFLDLLPPWSIYRLYQGAGFLLTFSALVRNGVKDVSALEALMVAATPWYRERIGAAKANLREGKNIGTAFFLAGHGFPDREIIQDLRSYETLPEFAIMLDRIGRDWLSANIAKIEFQMAIFKNLMLVLFTCLLLWFFICVFDFYQAVSHMPVN